MSNECSPVGGGCGLDFASLEAFDRHLESYPAAGPGKDEKPSRCLTPQEIAESGLELSPQDGKWYDPVARERIRGAFGGEAA